MEWEAIEEVLYIACTNIYTILLALATGRRGLGGVMANSS